MEMTPNEELYKFQELEELYNDKRVELTSKYEKLAFKRIQETYAYLEGHYIVYRHVVNKYIKGDYYYYVLDCSFRGGVNEELYAISLYDLTLTDDEFTDKLESGKNVGL